MPGCVPHMQLAADGEELTGGMILLAVFVEPAGRRSVRAAWFLNAQDSSECIDKVVRRLQETILHRAYRNPLGICGSTLEARGAYLVRVLIKRHEEAVRVHSYGTPQS
ncbi:hypothetical protein NDU88_007052 [Pleurodeles waltl]|uniref:Uncharacterized protein n=1 Tax=Pleurodeles waltl TaxID=8319 RepID=A0AAV7N180_PLEWA|nr:hypothetical protein NDU88_007052 [Pleurodeles waltl]